MMHRNLHRAGQFWRYLSTLALPPADEADVDRVLSPALAALFRQMIPGEQAHSLRVMRWLIAHQHTQPELLQAALLHDVGKVCAPLNIFERVVTVFGHKLFPKQSSRWAQRQPQGWSKAFVVARHHADWGADMVARAGAAPLTVNLIRRHQTRVTRLLTPEDELLRWLQRADDET
jgi:hypothetical protein